MNERYKLKFVNKGKEFVMPDWTVEKHETLLEEMIQYDEKLKLGEISQADYDKKYRTTMIMLSLIEIDKNLKISDLQKMHPDDFIELWVAVYRSGRTGIKVKDKDFQEGEQSPKLE